MNWAIIPTTQWVKDRKWYDKKRPKELAAVLHNLKRYLDLLHSRPNSLSVSVGFMHTEQAGVIAIDQSGGGKNLQETRLYIYADDTTRKVYLITIGNKQEQHDDVQMSRIFAEEVKKAVEDKD